MEHHIYLVFTGLIIFGIIWIIISFIIVGIYPIIENYGRIKSVFRLIYFHIKAFREREVEDIYPIIYKRINFKWKLQEDLIKIFFFNL
jgi:hypothetical protein